MLEASAGLQPDHFAPFAPAGHYVAIRISFVFPMAERNCLPETWVQEYTASGLLVHDPAMAWAHQHQGWIRTRELAGEDHQGVLELAKYHGLHFGAVACCLDPAPGGQRSFGFFFRGDRDYTEAEMRTLHGCLLAAHEAYARPTNLTDAELETLGLVKNGLLMKQIASVLGVSESAVKQRLRNARLKLNAKTGSQAAARATSLGII
jgi:LuxR family transcriptional regulator, quorum-sensing system regulator SdiA